MSKEASASRPDWAEKQRATAAVLAELGITPAEATLFNVLHYGLTTPPDDLCRHATCSEYGVGDEPSRAENEAALAGCLAKGWLQVIDDAVLDALRDEVRREGLIGPVYGYPSPGGVDLTHAGAEQWRRMCERLWPRSCRPTWPFCDTVHTKTVHYYVTESDALAAIEQAREYRETASIVGPVEIGPWRAAWWRRFPSGYRVDIEERMQWQGRASSGGPWACLQVTSLPFDTAHAQEMLDRHNVTLTQWLALAALEFGRHPHDVISWASVFARRFGLDLSRDAIVEGAKDCVRHRWLRKVSERTLAEIQSLLDADAAFDAVPYESENPPWGFDFTPAGAQTYRMVSEAIFGSDWEHGIRVEDTYYWEEHRYCATAIGLQAALAEHNDAGRSPTSVRTVPIGPWCVYWWERFESGYRWEFTFGEP